MYEYILDDLGYCIKRTTNRNFKNLVITNWESIIKEMSDNESITIWRKLSYNDFPKSRSLVISSTPKLRRLMLNRKVQYV